MHRTLITCLALLGLASLTADAAAPPKPSAKPKPASELYVILKAKLYEVDEAFHTKVAKAKWRSQAELEEWEKEPWQENPLFAQLRKQKPTLVGKVIHVDPDKQGTLLSAMKPMKCLPTPDQLRQGKKGPQLIDEGFTLRAHVRISSDRRFVRLKFMETSQEIEGVDRIDVIVDDKGTEAVGEVVSLREASLSTTRYVFDGGGILIALQARPHAVKKNSRWLVAEVRPRIIVEAEERERRGEAEK